MSAPTRFHNTLDLIFSLGLRAQSITILNPLLNCDHNVVKCTFNISAECTIHSQHMGHHKSLAWPLFASSIRGGNWDPFFLETDPKLAASFFYENLRVATTSFHTTAASSTKPFLQQVDRIKLKYHSKLSKLRSQFSKTSCLSYVLSYRRILKTSRANLSTASFRKRAQHFDPQITINYFYYSKNGAPESASSPSPSRMIILK